MSDAPPIPMVDLKAQYRLLKSTIDQEISKVLESAHYIRGPIVGEFECKLAAELDIPFVLGVANGTDALQVAMMALGIGPGDEVITPAFTFIATAEAAHLLGAVPVFADVTPDTFNIDPAKLEALITPRTRAIVPVHLFGQPADMTPILEIAKRHELFVIEDTAQAIGSHYKNTTAGTMSTVGTISFFPSKNLGAYGDAGAVMTRDKDLYEKMRMIASHGSRRKYYNEIVGVNSRLDSIQAAILKAKLPHLSTFNQQRIEVADRYDKMLESVEGVHCPVRQESSSHVFHQYTLKIDGGAGVRDAVATHLKDRGIATAVYYPKGLHQLPVYSQYAPDEGSLKITEQLANEVLSIPIFPEITEDQQERVYNAIVEALTVSV